MTLKFQTIGNGDVLPDAQSDIAPQRGDAIEYQHQTFTVKRIRFLIEGGKAVPVVEIEREQAEDSSTIGVKSL